MNSIVAVICAKKSGLIGKKIKKISKISDEQLQISKAHVLSKLKFIYEDMIPTEIWLASEEITKVIDLDDTDFIALTKFLEASLWTGDKVLYNGLKKINFKGYLNTTDLFALRAIGSGK